MTLLRLILATVFATAAVLINDHGGVPGDVGVAVLVFAAMWLIIEEAVARVQLAVHRAFAQTDIDQRHHDDGGPLAT